jgi:hypothetical protein
MATFSNLKDLEKFINQKAKEAMVKGNEVKDVVIETGKRHVQEDVYDVYTPTSYDRTGELKNNWKSEETTDGIAIFNDRRDDGKYVAEIVETGQGYQFDFDYNGVPRPFTENTRKELDGSNKLTDGLRRDLKAIGVDVE